MYRMYLGTQYTKNGPPREIEICEVIKALNSISCWDNLTFP
jgi:hypothetical protein